MTIVKRGKKNNPLQVGMLGLGHALVKCWEVQIDSGGWTGGVECGDEWGGVSWGGGDSSEQETPFTAWIYIYLKSIYRLMNKSIYRLRNTNEQSEYSRTQCSETIVGDLL